MERSVHYPLLDLIFICSVLSGIPSKKHKGGISPKKLREITKYVAENLASKPKVKVLAKISGLSVGHFSRAFRDEMGMSPHQYVLTKRIERAEYLIKSTHMNYLEIAIACGFYDQSHLTATLTKTRGAAPRKIRLLNNVPCDMK